jgi:FkbM family methyltransferase
VEAAIRLLLDREPESALELAAIAAQCADRPALLRHLLASEEFERLHPDLARAEAPSPVVVTLDDGVRIVVDLSDHAVGVPIARRMFERNELAFLGRSVRAGQHVVDGGAHAGLYALTMARLVGPSGSVHAFEPIGANAAWLDAGVRENAAEAHLHVCRAALTDRSGTAEAFVARRTFNPGSARLRGPGESPLPGHDVVSVPTVALDEADVPHPIGFVRLDVEGAEALALRGAARILGDDRPTVLVEVHADLLPRVSGTTAEALFEWMQGLGYVPRQIGAGTIGPERAEPPRAGVRAVVFLP